MKTDRKFVDLAISWKGRKESDGTHREIIDVYNSFKPLPRGYKVKYTDAWCATFVSAVAIKCGYTDIIPPECSCRKMIEQFEKLGVFVENENRNVSVGDIVFYDWQDDGKGDNMGNPDHVGIVTNVSRETFIVLEGNYDNSVKERVLQINAKYIRGFAVPKYEKEVANVSKPSEVVANGKEIKMNTLRKGSKGYETKVLQTLLKMNGYSVGWFGVDGDFGKATENAVKSYQKKQGLTVDGVVGYNTWNSLLKG